MLDTKKLDIAKLIKENNKFLAQSGSKRSWQQYEKTLAVERVVNDRLINRLAQTHDVAELVEKGQTSNYADTIDEQAAKIEIDETEL